VMRFTAPKASRGIPLFVVWWVMAALSGAAFAQQTGTVSFSQSTYFVNIDQSNAVITVSSSGSTDTVAFVGFATSDGTATSGVNYVATTGTVTFATNTIGATFSITILGNVPLQSTQSLNLALSNPIGATVGTPSTAVLSIINTNAQQLAFLLSAFSVNGDQSNAVITVVRTGGTNGTISADYATSDGTAKAGIDYVTSTGTVTLADGIVSNTFMVPIVLPENPFSTNQTVNLTLTNPQGAVLAVPFHAVLTIVANGSPILQFGAADYHVHEHVGRATINVLRFGDSSGTASVAYATSDGTGKNGVDYLSTNGTLVFTAGVESASFSFQFIEFRDFQSNKTVIASLNNVVGASLGTQVTAVVTIINDVTQTIALTNGGGDLVTMTLQHAGTMQTTTTEPVDIVLSDTDETSLLAIRVKKHGAGPGLLEVNGITGDGECRSINAPDIDLVGSGVQVSGYLKLLAVHDILNGASVIAGGDTNNDTKIIAHDINGATIDVTSRIASLMAARFVGGTINAPHLGKMVLKGDKRNGIPGDCDAAITLSGVGVPSNQNTLGALMASGAISNTSINVAGNVGHIVAAQMMDSTVYVGFTPTDPSNPMLGGTFVPGLYLESLSILSKVDGFANSDVAAEIIDNVHLASVVTDNGGLPFGVQANQSIALVVTKTPPFKWISTGGTDQSSGDFHVILP